MKKLLLLALVLGIVTNVSAIDFEDINYSVKGGVNYSSSSFENELPADASAESALGFNGGLEASLPIADKTSFVTGVGISQKATKVTGKLLGIDMSIVNSAMYLEVPFGINYEVADSISVYAGGYAGYALSQSSTLEVAGVTAEDPDATDTIRKGDYGVQLGAAWSMDEWTASVGYQLGLADVTVAEGNDKTSSIQAQVGYNF